MPTIYMTCTEDAYSYVNFPDQNNISDTHGLSIQAYIAHAWIKWNLNSQIPAGSTINYAYIHIYAYGGGNIHYGNPTAHLYDCKLPGSTSDLWSEGGLTWNNEPNQIVDEYIGDVQGPAIDQWEGPPLPIEYVYDVTNSVANKNDRDYGNGVSFRLDEDDSTYAFTRISSHRYGDVGTGSVYSWMEIDYDPPPSSLFTRTLTGVGF
jgi:hypothetical protein